MIQIRLTDEQARVIAQSLEPVQICDDQGNVLGILPPIWTPDDVAEAKRRLASDQPRYTTAQVLEHLRAQECPMTRYTVTWLHDAEDQLAEIWTEASDPQAVTDAANMIDKQLARDPGLKGKIVSEGLRELHVPPLYILYSVRELDRWVEVAAVRREAMPPPSLRNGQ